MTIDENVLEQLSVARTFAERGNVSSMDCVLNYVRACSKRTGENLSNEVKEIEKAGYRAAIPIELLIARYHAETGEIEIAEQILSLVKVYANRTGEDVSDDIKEIEKSGYIAAIPVELSVARYHALDGNSPAAENFISYAMRYARKAGQDISEMVAEIRALIKK
ncbi:MAG: hypothetical protein Q8Q01_00315 [archaeon]|nr:hypothetical protein [archaeon]